MRSIIRQAQVAAGVINCTTRACATQTRVKRIEGKTDLKEILSDLIPQEVQRVKNFRKAHDKTVVGTTSVEMMYGGMRGIKGLVYETSLLDADEGIRFRGFSIPECQKMLPKAPGGNEPLPEGLFFLLLTGAVPTEEQVAWVTREWHRRASIPTHVTSMLSTLPTDLHPMVQLVMASAALQSESKFAQAYAAGTPKSRYWEYAYEDAMDLIAKLPTVAAMIYKNVYRGHESVAPLKADLDWSGNFAQMLGFKDPAFAELMRLYLTIHADHEGGNVSAHTIHLVGSALSDPYLSYSAGMCGLAGPLHGLANQEVLVWLTKLVKEIGIAPTDDALRNYVETTMKKGQVVPGFGHAVLRKTDPRYTCQQEFANKHLPDDPLFKLVKQVFKVVPPVLSKTGKIKNPWPNVDAHSGVLLQYYGLKEMSYYTVLFGVSRALGTVAQYVWSRAFGYPIERPKSLSTDVLTQLVKSARPTEEMNE